MAVRVSRMGIAKRIIGTPIGTPVPLAGTARTAREKPKNRLPPSPINTRSGRKLKRRNPATARARAPATMVVKMLPWVMPIKRDGEGGEEGHPTAKPSMRFIALARPMIHSTMRTYASTPRETVVPTTGRLRLVTIVPLVTTSIAEMICRSRLRHVGLVLIALTTRNRSAQVLLSADLFYVK